MSRGEDKRNIGVLRKKFDGAKLLGRFPPSSLFGSGDALRFDTTQVSLLVSMILYSLSLARA